MGRVFFLTTIFVMELIKSEGKYSEEDLGIVKSLGRYFGIKYYAFVQNIMGVEVEKQLKNFSKGSLYWVALNEEQMANELSNAILNLGLLDRKMAIVTTDKLNFTSFLQKVPDLQTAYWFVFADSLNIFENYYVPMNTFFFVIHPTPQGKFISKVYNVQYGRETSTRPVGTWLHLENETLSSIALRHVYNTDFENVSLTMLSYVSDDYCISSIPKLALERMECCQHEIIKITATKLNFRIKRLVCPDRKFPYNFPNGSLSTLFIILDNKEADLSVASYIISQQRLSLYKYVWPTFTTRSMMYLKLSGDKGHWHAYLQPLDKRLWVALGAWILTGGLFLQIFEGFRENDFKFRINLVVETFKSILVSLQISCNQGIDNMSNWTSSRLICVLSFFLFLIVNQLYSGHLISSLMVVIPSIPFESLDGFFQDGGHRIITIRTGFHNFLFKKMVKERNAIELMVEDEYLPLNSKFGVRKLCDEDNLVFMDFRENIVQNELPCKIIEISKPVIYQSVGIGFPKDSPYHEFVKRELTLLHSTGILQRMRTHLLSYVKVEEKDTSDEEFVPVTFQQVASIFVLLWGGILISLAVFMGELIRGNSNKQTESQKPTKKSKRRYRLNVKHLKTK